MGGGWRRREEEEIGVPFLTDGAKSFANKFASPVSLHLAGPHQGSAALALTTTLRGCLSLTEVLLLIASLC